MILSDDQMGQILEQLIQRTLEKKLEWSRENDHFFLGLPNRTTVELAATDKGPDLIVKLKGPSGDIYGQVRSPKSSESPAGRLFQVASEQTGKSIFVDIMDSLNLSDSVDVEVKPIPPRLTPEVARTVLEKMAGDWFLDFSRGTEKGRITKDGKYFVNDDKEARFDLKVLAWNEETSTAEVAKDKADGRRLQIEWLTITPESMAGYAKHDGHKLLYKRLVS
jgi:hypothetical protein